MIVQQNSQCSVKEYKKYNVIHMRIKINGPLLAVDQKETQR